MKIKLDENLPASLVESLGKLGHDVDTAPQEGLAGHEDDEVFEAAQETKRFLITQDLDFSDVRKFRPGTHHGVMLVRLGNPGRVALARRVEAVFQMGEASGWGRCFVVVTDRKVRVRRP